MVAFSGCVTFHNAEFCASPDLAAGGECADFLDTGTTTMNSADYISWLIGTDPASATDPNPAPKICTSADTIAEWKGNIEKLCSEETCVFVQTDQGTTVLPLGKDTKTTLAQVKSLGARLVELPTRVQSHKMYLFKLNDPHLSDLDRGKIKALLQESQR